MGYKAGAYSCDYDVKQLWSCIYPGTYLQQSKMKHCKAKSISCRDYNFDLPYQSANTLSVGLHELIVYC